jgi:hypothetical protein
VNAASPGLPRRRAMIGSVRHAGAVLGVLAVLVALSFGAGGSAAAHPTLLFTDPAADTAVPVAPQAITLMFNEPVTIGSDAVVVLDKDVRAMPIGAATTGRAGSGRYPTAAVGPAAAAGGLRRPGVALARSCRGRNVVWC